MNIVESILVLVGITCMIIAAMLHHSEVTSALKIYNTILFVVGIVSEVGVVAIELLLFHLLEFKYKFFEAVYYIVEFILAVWVNVMIPFAGIVVLTGFSILKNIYRVLAVEKIYKFLGLYEFCKKFGIKIKKPRRSRKVVAVTTTKKKAKSKATKPVDATTTKSYA